MRQPKFKNINVTCPHDCPDTCSLVVTVDKSSGKAVKLKGDEKHPITKGFLCNKVNHYLDLVYNKNRVLYPHVRIGPKGSKGKFKKYQRYARENKLGLWSMKFEYPWMWRITNK